LGDVDVGLTTIEASFGRGLTRVHRNRLANLKNVREMERDLGETTLLVGGDVGAEALRVPVSRDHAKARFATGCSITPPS
jgi:DNA-binding LytR/AlgR family response regulator